MKKKDEAFIDDKLGNIKWKLQRGFVGAELQTREPRNEHYSA